MTTTGGVTVALAVLAAAGLLPTFSLVGTRWTLVPLSVLAGTVISAVAATCFLALGGSLMEWFLGLALLGGLASLLWLVVRPAGDGAHAIPVEGAGSSGTASPPGERVFRGTAAVALVATAVWCLRGLVTPMVGLDTRLFWFLRAGWWLWPHGQALANMHNIGADTHAGYPPLISSTVAVGWWLSGTHSDRIAAVLIAIVNVCAAVVAAWALVELGSMLSARLRSDAVGATAGQPTGSGPRHRWMALDQLPRWCGAGTAVLLVFTFFGVTSVFAFNGYADPLWSVAAVGAVAYLLLMPPTAAGIGAAAILLGVAGETKAEGTATAIAIIALVGLRAVLRGRGTASLRTRAVIPIAVVVGSAVALVVWPVVMRLRHVGADLNTSGARQAPLWSRAHTTYDALAPHLHLVLLALVLSAAGWFVLRGVRSVVATGSDGWAWATLVVGLVIVAGAYVDGPGSIYFLDLWLQTSAHRVTDFPALSAWSILAATTVTASAAPAALAAGTANPTDAPGRPVAAAGGRSE